MCVLFKAGASLWSVYSDPTQLCSCECKQSFSPMSYLTALIPASLSPPPSVLVYEMAVSIVLW